MEEDENKNFIYLTNITHKSLQKEYNIVNNENKKSQEKIRYHIFDNIKGILIFTVVFGHFLFKYSSHHKKSITRKIVVFIYSFHMPVFVFISGFLSSENSVKFNKAIKLLILYYIFNYPFSFILYYYYNKPFNFLFPKYSYWYLLSLFYWRISIKYIYKINYIFIKSIVISLLIGYFKFFSNFLSLVRTITFFPFFIAGYKISKSKKFDSFLNWRKGVFKTIFFYICFGFFLYNVRIFIEKNQKKIGNPALMMFSYNEKKHNTIKERFCFLIIGFFMTFFFVLFFENNEGVHFINKWGKNSLYIFLFHRIFPFITDHFFFNNKKYSKHIIKYSFLFTFMILFVFGSDFVNKSCNSILNFIHKNLLEYNYKGKIISFFIILSFIALLINPSLAYLNEKYFEYLESNLDKTIKKKVVDNSIRISYIGDLILLKDQVISAKNNTSGKYEFDDIFKYTSNHFHKSDLTIGVYEGPSAGNTTSYSTSNYGDGIPLYLNFPDEFAESVKKAGINLVTTANNHLLDKNLEGSMRTLDVLDKYNISHVGSYRNQEEKDKIFLINIKGIKIVVLAYTSNMNKIKMQNLYRKYKYLTGIIPKFKNKYYDEIYNDIKNDFIKAKKESPDIIIVLAHMGTQFIHTTNLLQEKWNKIFTELGANIILNDHSHSLQPLQYINNTFIVNSPGNFANSYIKYDGDSTAIIDIFINTQTKKITGASAIPMYTKEIRPKYFSAIPIYDLVKNDFEGLNEKEKKRVEKIQSMATKILLGKKIEISNAKKEYFFINNFYNDINVIDINNNFCDEINKYSNTNVYRKIDKATSITFIGDSITRGTKNGFHPWYEPMMKCFNNKKIKNISKGSYTTKLILKNFKDKLIDSKTDLYIIATGINDIRYRKESICAMDSKKYIKQIEKIVELVKNNNTNFIFISPWFSLSYDKLSKLNHNDKMELIKKYSSQLEKYSKKNNYIFVNPNKYLEKIITKNTDKYMVDYIHPNSNKGIELYSKSIFVN